MLVLVFHLCKWLWASRDMSAGLGPWFVARIREVIIRSKRPVTQDFFMIHTYVQLYVAAYNATENAQPYRAVVEMVGPFSRLCKARQFSARWERKGRLPRCVRATMIHWTSNWQQTQYGNAALSHRRLITQQRLRQRKWKEEHTNDDATPMTLGSLKRIVNH